MHTVGQLTILSAVMNAPEVPIYVYSLLHAPHVNNMATEQCMHALDHLALGRVGQFCDKQFEVAIFPA